jgi:hypothetical protein
MDGLLFHPKLVHVPMALAVLMPLVAAGLAIAWWRRWLPPRAWAIAVVLQAILFGSGILAMRSGEADEDRVEQVVSHAAIEEHEHAAEAFVWASGAVLGLVALTGLLAGRRAGLSLASVATVGTFVVLALGVRTGQAGGGLVYQHGAASAYAAAAPAPAHTGGDDDDD